MGGLASTPPYPVSDTPQPPPPGKRVLKVDPSLRGKERLAAVRENFPKSHGYEIEEVSDLLPWVKAAITRVCVSGETIDEAAAAYGKKGGTLRNYYYSPAGVKWRAGLREFTDDPVRMAESLLRATTLGVTLEYLGALEAAKSAGDYKEIGVMSRDLLDRQGVEKKRGGDDSKKPTTIVLNLGAGFTLEAPTVKASYTAKSDEITVDAELLDE